MSDEKKREYVTFAQRAMLIELIDNRPNVKSGKFSNSFTYKDAQKEWQEIADHLNSIPGARKDWNMWRRTWQDIKKNLKKKKCLEKQSLVGTGGGPFMPVLYDEDEEKALKMICPTSIEGDNKVDESLVVFNDHDYGSTITLDNSSEQQSPSCSSYGVKRKRGRLETSIEATQNLNTTLQKKLSAKERYYERKLELYERDVLAKERIAAALEAANK